MNNPTIINILNSDNSKIAFIKTQNCLTMATIAYRILKFEYMVKKPIVPNHGLFYFITFSRVNSFPYIISIVVQHL